jgi:hypothetical protein
MNEAHTMSGHVIPSRICWRQKTRSARAARPRQVGPVSGHVDAAAARAVAEAYAETATSRGPLVVAAYAELVTESDRLFAHLTRPDRPDRVRITFTTCPAPYADAQELIRSVRQDRLLEVTTVATTRDRHHPVMGNDLGGAYDRFRGSCCAGRSPHSPATPRQRKARHENRRDRWHRAHRLEGRQQAPRPRPRSDRGLAELRREHAHR